MKLMKKPIKKSLKPVAKKLVKKPVNSSDLLKKIKKVFAERITPMLAADGGGVKIIGLKGKILTVQLTGACGSCPYGLMTLAYGIQANIDDVFPKEKIIVQLAD